MLVNMSEREYYNGVPRSDLTTQACDMCRKRKVKCLLSRAQSSHSQSLSRCQRCERLNLQCTFNSPSKTRGPKRRDKPQMSMLHSERQYKTDDLCSRDLFKIIMQDYLDRIYPLVPIVHRPSFRDALLADKDCEDEGFSAVTLSIAALVVATLASRFPAYKSHAQPLRFSTRREFVHFCYRKILDLRSTTHFDELNFKKFSVPYLFSAAFLQLGEHNWSRMLGVEAMQIARLLNMHRISDYEGLNCIETQLRKKGFWLVFYVFVHGSLQNLHGERLTYLDPVLLQSINPEELMPLEIDDEFIFENEVVLPPDGTLCLTSGFVIHSRIFWASIRNFDPDTTGTDPCPCVRVKDNNSQVAYFQNRLHDLKRLLDEVPPYIQSWDIAGEASNGDDLSRHDEVLRAQCSSMRVNIYATHLWLQSLIMDQIEAVQPQQQSSFDMRALWIDREALSRQLLCMLFNSPPVGIEANGLHLANKIRDIAASLLSCPLHPEDPISKQVADYVQQSTDILSRLDSSEGLNTMHLPTWVDTDRISTGG